MVIKRDFRMLALATQAELRRVAVAMVRAGKTRVEAAETVGVNRRFVGQWEPCCMGRRCTRTEPYPCCGLCDADVLRAPEVQHAVQNIGLRAPEVQHAVQNIG